MVSDCTRADRKLHKRQQPLVGFDDKAIVKMDDHMILADRKMAFQPLTLGFSTFVVRIASLYAGTIDILVYALNLSGKHPQPTV